MYLFHYKAYMKKVFPIFLFAIILIFIFSCSSEAKRSRKPVTTISLNPNQTNYYFNESLSIRIQTDLKNGSIDNIKLYYGDSLLITENKLDFIYELDHLNKLGNNSISVVATKTDGIFSKKIINFPVYSDIVPKNYTYNIVNEFPHSNNFFTEGLLIFNNFLFEGTGEYGTSAIYKTDLSTGQITQLKELENKYFGEGITILDNKIYQLTYHSKIGFVYSTNDFSIIDTFDIPTNEGWGLTNDGTYLIMSNGTNKITWLEPGSFEIVKDLSVADNKQSINYINELEYINNTIFANVWQTDFIIEIDPNTGKVLSIVNLSGILNPDDYNHRIDVLNGIAYKQDSETILVTGKFWPKLFEISLVPLD